MKNSFVRCAASACIAISLTLGLSAMLSAGDITVDGKLVSTTPTGPPLEVTSSDRVDNLNADQVDGLDVADLATQSEVATLQAQLEEVSALVGLTQKTVFVTSQQFSGDLGGVNGALATCNDAARAAGLFGFYRPWLGDPSATFVQATVPYVSTDGVMVAADWADLTDGVLLADIDRDEFGNDLSATSLLASSVWSNVDFDGTPLINGPSSDCTGWTATPGSGSGTRGMIGLFKSATAGWWSASKTADPSGPGYDFLYCDNSIGTAPRLYCFQQ